MFAIFRLKGTDDSYFKTNLAIYDNDMLVVTGTSYYLWILDNYKDISAEVQRLWEEEHKVAEEEDCPEEESNQETLDSARCCEAQITKVRSSSWPQLSCWDVAAIRHSPGYRQENCNCRRQARYHCRVSKQALRDS